MLNNFVISPEYFTWTSRNEKTSKGHFIAKITGKDGRVFYFDPNGCIGAFNGGITHSSFEDKLRDGNKGDGRRYQTCATNANSLNYTNLHTTDEWAYWFLAAATECVFEENLDEVVSKFESKEMLRRISARFIKFKEFARTKNKKELSFEHLQNEEIDILIELGGKTGELDRGSINFLRSKEPQNLPAFAILQGRKSSLPILNKSVVSAPNSRRDSYIKIQTDLHNLQINSRENLTNEHLLELFVITERIADFSGFAKNNKLTPHEFVALMFCENIDVFNEQIALMSLMNKLLN